MATRISRAATAANNKGGRHVRKNKSVELFNTRKHLRAPENREASALNRRETLLRRHNQLQNRENESEGPGQPEVVGLKNFKLFSSVFGKGGTFPVQFTGEGQGLSPPLRWAGIPPGTNELVLICEELGVSGAVPTIHWLLYRIPVSVRELPEGILPDEQVDSIPSILQGRNSNGMLGYFGPLPPLFDEWHRYCFRLYALDSPLQDLRPGMTYDELVERMRFHVIGETRLIGRYRRSAPRKKAG